MSGRFRLTIHPDDANTWKAMTGRNEETTRPLTSQASLDYMLDSARRNGVRILAWQALGEDE